MANYKELREQADHLWRQADEAARDARTETLAQVLAAIKEFEFTAKELGLKMRSDELRKNQNAHNVDGKFTRAAKYRDPVTGTTWTGAGRQPKWIMKDKEAYLIARDDG